MKVRELLQSKLLTADNQKANLEIIHSKDLVNWKVVNYILPKVPEFRYRNPIHGCGVWAPAIRYHDGKFFVCFPMPDEGIYMTTATDPYGEWSEFILNYSHFS